MIIDAKIGNKQQKSITDKVSKNELAQLLDFNPKIISVILDTFRLNKSKTLENHLFFEAVQF